MGLHRGKIMWKEFIANLSQGNDNVIINAPASQNDIVLVEKKLGTPLPKDLTTLLLEMNGDRWFLMSTDEIIEDNLLLRGLECYMPLDCLLFFAQNGCGDYFGYPIRKDGLNENDIFMWDHEYDNRTWCANGLNDVITKYYSGKI